MTFDEASRVRTGPSAADGRDPTATDNARAVPRVVRVLIVDDHQLFRTGLRRVLEASQVIRVVGEASSYDESVALLAHSRPDVALLDVCLRGGTGIEVCRWLALTHPTVRSVMLTALSDEPTLLEAVAAGAAGYLHKDIDGDRLVGAVLRVMAGGSLFDAKELDQLMERTRLRPDVAAGLESLTAQERNIVDLVVQGLTNREIGAALFLSEKTVRNYVSNILGKVGLSNRTALATHVTRLNRRGPADGNVITLDEPAVARASA